MNAIPSGTPAWAAGSLFEAPWWLDAVSPSRWGQVEVEAGAGASARLVYERIERHGLSMLRNPPLTQAVGPHLRLSAEKHESRLGQCRELAGRLIDSLPTTTLVRLVLSPDFDDYLPFRWAGFGVGLACTHRIRALMDSERVWHGFAESVRRAVRKGEKKLVVRDDVPVGTALDVAALSFVRQGLPVPYDRALVERAVAAARANAGAWMLAAEDATGRRHAAMLVVHDDRCAYYVLGGADPELRDSGAQSLLMWEALKRCSGTVAEFDFEGSSTPGIERFFRGFGPQRCPLLVVTRSPRWLQRAAALGFVPRRLAGEP